MKTPLIWIRQAGWTLWLALALAALLGLRSCWADEPAQREVSVVGYNYTDRPIYTFSVNGGAGSNIFINGGGGILLLHPRHRGAASVGGVDLRLHQKTIRSGVA